jgi:hypothetical protein
MLGTHTSDRKHFGHTECPTYGVRYYETKEEVLMLINIVTSVLLVLNIICRIRKIRRLVELVLGVKL